MIKNRLKRKKDKQLPIRITNDTVAEHREKVLAGGRKHKYPIQYTKYKLVRNTILISIVGVVIAGVLIWLQLYRWKDTSDLAYRITRILPLPIARIDGEFVRYSNYLLYHRSTVAIKENRGTTDAADKMAFQRKQAMERVLEDAYAQKLARERKIVVSDDQVNASISKQRQQSKLSETAYERVVKDHLGWSMDELRQAIRATLLRQAVAFSVDDLAAERVKTVEAGLREGKNLQQIASELGQIVQYVAEVSVPIDNSDGGLSEAALKLEPGKTSRAVKTLSGDGYYFILLHSSDGATVKYSYLKVPLTAFKTNFDTLKKNKVEYFIEMDHVG